MFKKLRNNENGVIFVTVLIIIIISMVLAISIHSVNTAQTMAAEEEYRRIQAEMIAHGEQIRYMGSQIDNQIYNPETYNNVDSRDFTLQPVVDPATGPLTTDTVDMQVSF